MNPRLHSPGDASVMAFRHKREGPAAWASEGVDMLRQVWDAPALRRGPSRIAWLEHTTAGRTRRLWGRPRKFDVAHSRFLKHGYAPCTAEFVSVDGRFYDAEQTAEMWDSIHGGPSRPWRPVFNDGQLHVRASQKTATIRQMGRLATYPRIVVHGPCKNPKVSLSHLWSVQLNMTINDGDHVTISPRPRARTVTHTSRSGAKASVADKLTRPSGRLADITIPPGHWTASMSYTPTARISGPRVQIKWRDAHAWW